MENFKSRKIKRGSILYPDDSILRNLMNKLPSRRWTIETVDNASALEEVLATLFNQSRRAKWIRWSNDWRLTVRLMADKLHDLRTGPARREAWTKSDNWDTVGVSSGTKRVINLPNWSSRFNFDPHSRTMPTSRTCLFNYPPSQLILLFFAIWVKKVNLFFLFACWYGILSFVLFKLSNWEKEI